MNFGGSLGEVDAFGGNIHLSRQKLRAEIVCNWLGPESVE